MPLASFELGPNKHYLRWKCNQLYFTMFREKKSVDLIISIKDPELIMGAHLKWSDHKYKGVMFIVDPLDPSNIGFGGGASPKGCVLKVDVPSSNIFSIWISILVRHKTNKLKWQSHFVLHKTTITTSGHIITWTLSNWHENDMKFYMSLIECCLVINQIGRSPNNPNNLSQPKVKMNMSNNILYFVEHDIQ